MPSWPTQNTEDVGDGILSYFSFTSKEIRLLKKEIVRKRKSRRLGVRLCEEINDFLVKNNGLKFKLDVDRLHVDETFSFETLKYRNKENEDLFNVLIRITPRVAEPTKDGVQPSLLNAVATVEVGGSSKELKLDAYGETSLEGIAPEIHCRFVYLKPAVLNRRC